jgi:hypothetical protein
VLMCVDRQRHTVRLKVPNNRRSWLAAAPHLSFCACVFEAASACCALLSAAPGCRQRLLWELPCPRRTQSPRRQSRKLSDFGKSNIGLPQSAVSRLSNVQIAISSKRARACG